MLPDDFVKRIHTQKYLDADALLKALAEPSPVSIRINPSKWNMVPKDSDPVSWCTNGNYLRSRPSFTLDPLFHSGCYYPQEASSMFLEQVIRQAAGSLENLHVLDLCGAPGGKSSHLYDLIGHTSLLVSNEVIRSRAVILAETVTKWGSGNILVTQNDPSAFGRLTGYFDIILIDAPCSGEGMFRSSVALDEWSEENTMHCSERQKRILMDVWPALKENGILIYSTCTFNPGENEENIKWLTDKHKSESISLNISDFVGIREIDFQGVRGYGFYPDQIRGEGFFITVIRKTGIQESIRVKSQRKQELKPGKDDLAVALKWTEFPSERILKWGDEVLSVPCEMEDYMFLYQNLKIVKPGTKIFVLKGRDYLPSHEIALSNKLKTDSFPVDEIGLSEALSYLKRDNFILQNQTKGWNIASYKSINLGFFKNLGNRINNYFPVEWRIRMNIPEAGSENILKWEQESFHPKVG
jgi:16S rRNA C967 or C1407 C5-methylase (RsmB/RsmF family)/NOL1/NOP2/fmu family ribosome biogenesis protein